jgi:hypothetical protein
LDHTEPCSLCDSLALLSNLTVYAENEDNSSSRFKACTQRKCQRSARKSLSTLSQLSLSIGLFNVFPAFKTSSERICLLVHISPSLTTRVPSRWLVLTHCTIPSNICLSTNFLEALFLPPTSNIPTPTASALNAHCKQAPSLPARCEQWQNKHDHHAPVQTHTATR